MRKVFISYRHRTHKHIKDKLIQLNDKYELFIDKSVDSGDIPDYLPDERIRQIIRDKKLKDSTVTLFIHGNGTGKRKFIDWEIAGSMIDYKDSKRNAIIVINTDDWWLSALNTDPKDIVNNILINMQQVSESDSMSEDYWRQKLPNAPKRLIINMARKNVNINVIRWTDIQQNPYILKNLIEKVYEDRKDNDYDATSLPLQKRNG